MQPNFCPICRCDTFPGGIAACGEKAEPLQALQARSCCCSTTSRGCFPEGIAASGTQRSPWGVPISVSSLRRGPCSSWDGSRSVPCVAPESVPRGISRSSPPHRDTAARKEGRRGLSLSRQPEVSLVFPLGADPGAGSCRAVNNGDGSSGKPNMGIVPLGSCFSPLGRGVAAARSVGMLAVGMGQGLGSLQGSKPKIETFFSAGLPALLGKESKDVTL